LLQVRFQLVSAPVVMRVVDPRWLGRQRRELEKRYMQAVSDGPGRDRTCDLGIKKALVSFSDRPGVIPHDAVLNAKAP
jgi:hypothetical protein